MKKVLFFIAALAILVSCQKESVISNEYTESETEMSFSIAVNQYNETETKALKEDWDNGDVVFVFFKNIESKYIKKVFNGTSWEDTFPGGAFSASDFSAIGEADKTMTAIHFPFSDVTVNYSDSKFSFTRGGKKVYTYYMYNSSSYSVSGTEVSGKISMQKPDKFVQFFVPGEGADVNLYHFMENHLTPKACSSVSLAGVLEESALVTGHPLIGYPYSGGIIFSGYLETAGLSTSYEFQLVKDCSVSKPFAIGTYTLSGTKNIGNNVVLKFPNLTSWTFNDWVDLGLSVRWGTKNIGATSPDAYGDYYAWGETSTKTDYTWATYTLCEGDSNHLKKYNNNSSNGIVDNKTVLEPGDDISTTIYGGNYRMGTDSEWTSLREECVWTWKTNAAVKGYLVSSKKYEGLAIFLPAAGGRSYKNKFSIGSGGFYWSSTCGSTTAWYVLFSDTSVSRTYYNRFYGLSIRPVCSY
ncbi:MAG: hypothetical protein IJ714_09890 [Bacteroidales bacterium]|nr:hypothetical protein [Bacteroidales bacterium]